MVAGRYEVKRSRRRVNNGGCEPTKPYIQGFLDWRLQKVGEKSQVLRPPSSAKAAKIMIEISRHQQEHEMFQRSIQEHPLAGTAKLWQPCSRPSGCSSGWEMLKTLVDALHPHKADMHKITCAESYCGRIRVVGDIVSRGMSGLGTRWTRQWSKLLWKYDRNTHGWHCQKNLMILEVGHTQLCLCRSVFAIINVVMDTLRLSISNFHRCWKQRRGSKVYTSTEKGTFCAKLINLSPSFCYKTEA